MSFAKLELTVIQKSGHYGAGVALRAADDGEVLELLSLYYERSKRPAFIPVNALVHGLRRCHALNFDTVQVVTDLEAFYKTVTNEKIDYDFLHHLELSRRFLEGFSIEYVFDPNIHQARQLALDALERRKPMFVNRKEGVYMPSK